MNSKNNSFDDDYIKQGKNNKNNLEQKNNDKIIENKNINEIKDKKGNNNNENNTYKNKIVKINENVVKIVEKFGYNRKYIIKSLQTNEINHAVASYYLALSLFNEK